MGRPPAAAVSLAHRARTAYLCLMRYALATVILAANLGSAVAQGLPPTVAAALDEAKNSCKPDAAIIAPDFLKKRDINGDGIVDFVIDYAGLECPGSGRVSCGSAGCYTEVFASSPSGYVRVLNENVQGLSFRKIKGRPAMILGLHGSSCGKVGAANCGATLFWNGERFSPAN